MSTKRIIFAVLLFLVSVVNSLADVVEGKCGANITYSFDDDTDILTIIGEGEMDNYVSADLVPWNKLIGEIKKVEIKPGVTSIGDYAFFGCELLWKIQIPTTVTRIGAYSFGACVYLFEANLPETVTEIGSYAYRGCTNLETFTFPSSLQQLGTGVLYGCNGLKKVSWNNSIREVPNYTFAYCSVLSDVQLPKEITKLGDYSFAYCAGLSSFSMPDSLVTIGSYAFEYCSLLDNIVLPEKLSTINAYSFYNCKALSYVDIPGSVKSIGNYAFHSCSNLKRAKMHVGLTSIGYQAFIYCSSLDSVALPRSLVSMSTYVFHSCTNLTTVTLPDGLHILPERTFVNCSSLKNVNFPNTLTGIDVYAFQNCTSLRKMEFPSSICSFGTGAFSGAKNLDTIIIRRVREPLVSMGTDAFLNVPDTMVVVVPCSRYSEYVSSESWKRFAPHIVSESIPYLVSAATNNAKWGSVRQSGLACVVDGFADTLTAIPAAGYEFLNWIDGDEANPRVVKVGSDTTLTAVFTKIADKGKCGETLNWSVNEAGVLSITGSGDMFDFEAGKAPWGDLASSITRVNLDSSVTSIGANAFANLTALNSLEIISPNVVKVGKDAFKGMDAGFVIYVSCALIDSYASDETWFTNTALLRPMGEEFKITLKVNDPELGSASVLGRGCVGNVFMDTLYAEAVPGQMFSFWADNENITTPMRVVPVTSDAEYTAVFSKEIASGQCGDDVWWSFSNEGSLLIKGDGAMYNFATISDVPWQEYIPQIKSVIITEGVTTVGNYSFYGCANMKSVYLPSSIKTIGSYAFYSCMDLMDLTIPQGVTTLNTYCFSGCTSLRSVVVPASVKTMGTYVFSGCTLIESAVIEAPLTSVPNYTFSHNNALKYVKLPSTITSIGSYAFYRCYSLEDFEIPSTVKTINSYAFCDCRLLKEVKLPENLSSLGTYALSGCSSLTEVEVPANIQTVADALFYRCTNLERVKLPAIITSIGSSAFANCTSLKEVNFPTALTTISSSAFRYCSSLTDIKLSPNVLSIGEYSFANCPLLRKIELPNSLTSISRYALSTDTMLTKVVIPEKVLIMGEHVFNGSKHLDTLQIKRAEDALTSLDANGLYAVPASMKVYVPCKRIEDYKNKDVWKGYAARIVSDLELYHVTLAVNEDTLGTVNHSGLYCGENGVTDSLVAGTIGGSTFLYWSDGSKENPRVVTVTSDTLFKAVFLGIVSRGKCGDNLSWELDTRGILSISGFGRMYDYNAGMAPWSAYADLIKTVTTSNETESIGDFAFYGCEKLTVADLSASVASIGKSAFSGCSALAQLKTQNTTSAIALGASALANTPATLSVYVPCSMVDNYQQSADWKNHSLQVASYGQLYSITVSSNVDTMGTATLHSVECKDNKLVASLEANALGTNRFSVWSDNEDLEDTLRTMIVDRDTNIVAVFAKIIDEGQCGKTLYWNLDDQGKLLIYGTGAMYNFSAGSPAGWSKHIENIKRIEITDGATTVGNYAFYAATALKKVTIPQSVTSVGTYAFYSCSNLNNVLLPNELKTLGTCSFYGCSRLEEIVVPDKVTSMGTYVFAYCSALRMAEVNANVATLGEYFFNGCSSLVDLRLNSPVTTIQRYAFNGCRKIETIRLPETLTTLGDHVFCNCVELQEINLPYGLTSVPSATFYNCYKLDNVVIPSTVNTLGGSAFLSCKSLKNFTLPFTLGTIDTYCFRYCSSLTELKIPGGVPTIADYAFADCPALRKVFIPNSVTSIGQYAFYNCTSLTRVAVPSTVVSLGANSFYGCSKLDTLLVRRYQDPLTELKSGALTRTASTLNIYLPCSRYEDYLEETSWKSFYKRMYMESYLYSIALYPNYKSRGSARVTGTGCSDSVSVDTIRAFNRGCGRFSHWSDGNTNNPRVLRVTSDSLLEAIFLADTVRYGTCGNLNWTLYCDSLLVIDGEGEIPDYEHKEDVPWYPYRKMILYGDVQKGVTKIGKNAFNNDSLLLGVTMPSTLQEIHDSAFANCASMDTLTIPANVRYIGDAAMAGSHLYYIYMPDSVMQMGKGVFASCKNLKVALVPNHYTHLADSLFAGCVALERFTMPSALRQIEGYAFAGCTALQTLQLPDSLVTIGEGAFAGCSELHHVSIPDAVATIADKAFAHCVSMDTVECLRLEGVIPTLGTDVFDSQAEGRTIFVDCNRLLDYRKAADWQTYRNAISTYGLMFETYLAVSADTAGTAEITYSVCDENGTRDSILATPIGCHRFLRWSDGVTENPRMVVLDKDTSLTAIFRIGYIDMGTCGDNIEWEISCDSILKITGTGAIPSYSEQNAAPWSGYASAIKQLQVASGVTAIGNRAFADLVQIEQVYLPQSVIVLGSESFVGCARLDSVRMDAETMVTADSSTFANVAPGLTVYVPCVLQDDYKTNHGWVEYESIIRPIKVPYVVNAVAIDDTLGSITGDALTCIDTLTRIRIVAVPEEGALFVRWDDGSADTARVVNVASDTTFTAYFTPDTFLVEANGVNGLGSVSGTGRYAYRHIATLIPTPIEGHHFVRWSTGSTNPRLDTLVKGNINISAEFAIDTCRLTVLAEGNGVAYSSGTFLYGDKVELHAVADTLHHLVAWSNGVRDTLYRFNIKCDTVLTANFAIDSFAVTADVIEGKGSVTGLGIYPYGTAVTLTPVAERGYHFLEWADGSKRTSIDTLVTRDIEVLPVFEIDTYTLTVIADGNGAVNGGGRFEFNTKAYVEAAPALGHHLVGWSTGKTSLMDTVLMASDSVVTAYFAIDTFMVDAIAENGRVEGTGNYIYGDSATLVAIPDTGYHFEGWLNGDLQTSTGFKVYKDSTLTALFAIDSFKVNLSAVNGEVYGAGTYAYGEVANLSAVPAEHHHFMNWSDGNKDSEFALTVHSDVDLAAYFAIDSFKVNITTNENVTGDTSGIYPYGDTLTLTVLPVPGHHFMGWSNGASSETIEIRVEGDTTLSPIFAVDTFMIDAVAVNGSVSGTGLYTYQSEATLTATPEIGYHFLHWSTGAKEESISFTVTRSDTLTAIFAIDTFNVVVKDEEHVNGDKSGFYVYGDTIQLKAVPSKGYHFDKWSTGEKSAAIAVRIVSDTVITPYFLRDSLTVSAIAENGKVKGVGTYAYADTVKLNAVGNKGYRFDSWEDGATNAEKIFVIKNDTTLTAYFTPDSVWIEVVNEAFLTGVKTGAYAYGDTLNISVLDVEGYHFVSWSDGSKDKRLQLIVKGDTTLLPFFDPNLYYVEVANNYPIEGDQSGYYFYGDTLHLSAPELEGRHFMGWSTGETESEIVIRVVSNKVIEAYYQSDSFKIDANTLNGRVSGLGQYAYGDTAHLIAKPYDGYVFIGWSGTTITDSVLNLVVTSNETVKPVFIENPNAYVDVYDVTGKCYRVHVLRSEALVGLPKGVYILRNGSEGIKVVKYGDLLSHE